MRNLKLLFSLLLILTIFSSCAELAQLATQTVEQGTTTSNPLTNTEIISGLKDALAKGTDYAVQNLASENGYLGSEVLKIYLPDEAKVLYDKVENIPVMDVIIDNTVTSINRAAEDAANQAKPIFLAAITNMTIQDGLAILNGSDSSATEYLKSKTSAQLFNSFKPKIEASLSKTYVGDISAEATYKQAIDAYNGASLNGFLWPKISSNSLSDHTTQKALDGLFLKVAEEEKAIRKDPVHRVSEILKRVFGYQE
ncbi:MAG: DUF4197 domain-containing protein [Salibacteraceae bacterium]